MSQKISDDNPATLGLTTRAPFLTPTGTPGEYINEQNTLAALVAFLNSAAARPAFSAHRNGTNQTGVPNATWTKIAFTHELFDTAGAFASGTFTPLVAGKYLITFAACAAALGAGKVLGLSIYKNGARFKDVISMANGAISDSGINLADVIELNGSTDNCEGYVFHNHGSNLDFFGATNLLYMSGVRVA